MRKSIFALLFGACFLACYAIGLLTPWSPLRPEPAAPFLRTTEAAHATETPLAPSSPAPPPGEIDVAWPEETFRKTFASVADSLLERFRAPYPAAEGAASEEQQSRTGILAAMDSAYRGASTADLPAIINFYLSVAQAEGERPPVRRRAFRNISAIAGHLDEPGRMELLARAGFGLDQASKGDAELLTEIFQHAR